MSDPNKAHSSVVGGSSAERVLNCSGSVRLTQEAIQKKSSIYADEGTSFHLAVEHILNNDLHPEDVIGMKFHTHDITAEVVAECIRPCIEAFEQIVGTHDFELESRQPLPEVPGAFGTADVVYFDAHGNLIGIIDWKFGAGKEVDAEDNEQMMFYLRSQLAREDVPGLEDNDVVFATIVQPRLGPPKTAKFRVGDLRAFAWALKAAISGPEFFQKGSWCHWCIGKPRCPEKWGKRAERMQRGLLHHSKVT